MSRKRPDRNLVMAPSHSDTGAMVYLARKRRCQGKGGAVVSIGNQDASTQRDGIDLLRGSKFIEGFPQGLKPENVFEGQFGTAKAVPLQSRMEAIDSALSGTAHLKSFPSEKMKRGHYV